MAIIKGLHAQLIKEQLENALKKKGHAFFDGNKKYNLNIIGIRNKSHDLRIATSKKKNPLGDQTDTVMDNKNTWRRWRPGGDVYDHLIARI